jgi:hypothetical protein
MAWFIATEPFGPQCGKGWEGFIAWSRLTQLEEIVSLDGILCPTVLREIKDEYWPHIVNEDFLLNFFVDYDFLKQQVAKIPKKNILCVYLNPTELPTAPGFADFRFLGYDLVDKQGEVSALTNCGGFPEVFDNAELSPVGLLTDLDRAVEVQRRLHASYPDSHHADCNVWAIFRLAE